MLLLELEEQIKPLSRTEKQELFQFLAMELQHEAVVTKEGLTEQDFDVQPDTVQLMMTAQAPYWPLYDAYDAAKTLLEVAQSDLPVI